MSQQVREAESKELLVEEKESVIFEEKEVEQLKETIMNLPTEGIVKAEGLNWKQLVIELMRHIIPWKGRLGLSFCFGVLRVLSFIGVGIFSALIVLELKNGNDYSSHLSWLITAAILSGILHWLESWICLLYTSPSPRDRSLSRMPSSA